MNDISFDRCCGKYVCTVARMAHEEEDEEEEEVTDKTKVEKKREKKLTLIYNANAFPYNNRISRSVLKMPAKYFIFQKRNTNKTKKRNILQ